MPRIGIVVEGLDDEAALPELIQRSLTTQVEIVARHWGPASVLMRNFRVSLEEFRSLDIHLAIVIRDADNKPPREIYQRMQDRVSGREYRFQREFHVIVQELEAWLIADEIALSQIIGQHVKPIVDPESKIDPKAILRQQLTKGRVDYTPAVARRIASTARIDILQARCPSFREFQAKLCRHFH